MCVTDSNRLSLHAADLCRALGKHGVADVFLQARNAYVAGGLVRFLRKKKKKKKLEDSLKEGWVGKERREEKKRRTSQKSMI
jgi:hypothetical protein